MVWRDDWVQPDNTTLMSHELRTNTSLTLNSAANNQRYFPYASSESEDQYEVSGPRNASIVSTTSTTYPVPDIYGNFGTVTQTVTDKDSTSPYLNQVWTTTVTNSYSTNSGLATWCVGLPTKTTVVKYSTTESQITRTIDYTPDYSKCNMTQQVVAKNNSTYQVTEDLLYDAFGNVNSDSITGINLTARTTLIDWGPTGQFPMSVTNPLNQKTLFDYDFDQGFRTSVTDPNGVQTTWLPDNFARMAKETHPDNTYATTDYTACSANNSWCGTSSSATELKMESYIKNYGTGGALINQQYVSTDGNGRTRYKKHTDIAGNWSIEQLIYDSLSRVSKQSVPYQGTAYFTTIHYDLLNRVKDTQRPISAGNSTLQTTTYSYQGRTLITTDPQGKTTTRITHVTGALGRSKDHNGYYQDFVYDAFGGLLSVKDSSSPVNTLFTATYDYGLSAYQHTAADIDRGSWNYTYDALGELISYKDAKLQNFTFDPYDALGRPTKRTEPDLVTTWTWGNSAASFNIGKLGSISAVGAATYSESYTYDNAGRLTKRRITPSPIGAQDFDITYDSTTGLTDTLTYPTSTSSYRLKLQYGYANGYLQSVSNFNTPATVYWTANSVNAMGEVTQEALGTTPTAVIVNRVYDAVTGWMSSNQAGVGGGTGLANQSYLYDLVGNLAQRQNNALGLTETVCYDNLYRLDHTTATGLCTGATTLQMSYDAMGNIASRSDVNAGAAWTYDPTHKHQVRTAGTGNSYSYDANGNMSARNGNVISWTSYNSPSAINAPGESASFDYGPDHDYWRQIYSGPSGVETTYYISPLLERVDTGGVSYYRHYITANGRSILTYTRDTTGTILLRYLVEDHEGSIAEVVNGTGGSYVSESFEPFGTRRKPTTWSGPPINGDITKINGVSRIGYTGQLMLGSMGLIHMHGRVEDSITGRFISADPYVTEPENTQDFNRYSYVYSNPLSYVDPSGYACNNKPTKTDDPGGWYVTNYSTGLFYNGKGDNQSPGPTTLDLNDAFNSFVHNGNYFGVPTNYAGGTDSHGSGCGGTRQPPPTPTPRPPPATTTPHINLPCSAATTTNSSGHGIAITLAYTDAHFLSLDLADVAGYNHTFIIATDPSTGESYASRAGPGSGRGGGPGVNPISLRAQSGNYDSQFPDFGAVNATQSIGYIEAPFAQVKAYMQAFGRFSNAQGGFYGIFAQNSNSYAFTLLTGMGFDRPTPAETAPGWWSNWVDSSLACTRP